MNIGQAAKLSGISAKMIRYYEQIGLIPKANRSDAGYRNYSSADAQSFRFIRRARDLGFSVEQISELLVLWCNRDRASADVKALALSHADGLKTKIVELQAMVQTLEQLAENCHGDGRPDWLSQPPQRKNVHKFHIEHLDLGVTHPPRHAIVRHGD